mmetsp:Transcript_38557/g.119153  ORF Transcript_38557/g.119153 Transcript_38557/m.119153 type:complete len:246 (-) Transcript_38557:1439-2176(-)
MPVRGVRGGRAAARGAECCGARAVCVVVRAVAANGRSGVMAAALSNPRCRHCWISASTCGWRRAMAASAAAIPEARDAKVSKRRSSARHQSCVAAGSSSKVTGSWLSCSACFSALPRSLAAESAAAVPSFATTSKSSAVTAAPCAASAAFSDGGGARETAPRSFHTGASYTLRIRFGSPMMMRWIAGMSSLLHWSPMSLRLRVKAPERRISSDTLLGSGIASRSELRRWSRSAPRASPHPERLPN